MKIEITPKKTDGVERLLQISVPVETVRDAEEQAARRYATRVRLPGFRPGKAPASMIKKKFADAIRQEMLESLVQEAYKEVLERENFKLGIAAARPRREVRRQRATDVRAAHRSSAGARALAHAGLPGDPHRAPRHGRAGSRADRPAAGSASGLGARRGSAGSGRHGHGDAGDRRRDRRDARGQAVSAGARRRTGDSGDRRAHHGSASGRDGRAAGEVAGRFP